MKENRDLGKESSKDMKIESNPQEERLADLKHLETLAEIGKQMRVGSLGENLQKLIEKLFSIYKKRIGKDPEWCDKARKLFEILILARDTESLGHKWSEEVPLPRIMRVAVSLIKEKDPSYEIPKKSSSKWPHRG